MIRTSVAETDLPRPPVPGPRHRAFLLATVLAVTSASGGRAHEPVDLPLRLDGRPPGALAVVRPADHLAFSAPQLDFDEVAIGGARVASIEIASIAPTAIEVAIEPPASVTASVEALSLAAGETHTVELTWTPTSIGDLATPVSFSVHHAGVVRPTVQELPLVGTAGEVDLRIDVPTFGLSDVDTADFGLVSVEETALDSPFFDVVITNRGSVTARELRAVSLGPGGVIEGLGLCFERLAEAAICLSEIRGGTSLETAFFGDLAPGDSVTTRWRIVPAQAGLVDEPFDLRYLRPAIDVPANQVFQVAGEVIPFSMAGEGFLRNGPGSDASPGIGGTVDPLTDALAGLRPTGFDARTVFSAGDIDTVDLRTGAATLVVPIGGPQVARGPLGYELRAVFNSHLWYRKTLAEIDFGGEERAIVKPVAGEYPNTIHNLGTGWSFHLGRLLPPFVMDGIALDGQCPNNPLAFEKNVDTGPRFVYVEPDGTKHEFWRELHGEENEPAPNSATPRYDRKPFLYARDGSYFRLGLDPSDPDRRWVEAPNGIKRFFVRQSAPFEPTLPDAWRLESIEDPHGNRVVIDYGASSWTIRDVQPNGVTWRTVAVNFTGWSGRTAADPMVVSSVVLPGFKGGPTRDYTFDYAVETLEHPSRSAFHQTYASLCPGTDLSVRMPRLTSIDLPDGSRFHFDYEHPADDKIRLASFTLPTGATTDYQYAAVFDSPADCQNNGQTVSLNGVTRRTVSEVDGNVLADRRFLRESLRTPDVPSTICQAHSPGDLSSNTPPWSEQTAVVWAAHENGLSTASVHHFNLYPFDDDCTRTDNSPVDEALCAPNPTGPGWRLKSRRTHLERNLKISHSRPKDLLDPKLHLSEERYQCTFGLHALSIPRNDVPGTASEVGDDVSALLDACVRTETTYADYDVSRAGIKCQAATPHCLRDSRLRATRTYYDDDVDTNGNRRWIHVENSSFDGLGHYRRTVTRSTFETTSQSGRHEQTRFQNWNPGVGTVILDDDHRVTSNIRPPDLWVLGRWSYQWVEEDGQRRGSEACFDTTRGHLTHQRTWAATTLDTESIASNRRSDDVVVVNEVNSVGELTAQRFFGADTFDVPGGNWCASSQWTKGNQDYAILNVYTSGVLSERQVEDESTYALRRTIDRDTGWTKKEIRDSGETITFDYDGLGRATWATSNRTASQHVDYRQQTDGRWRLTATTYPRATSAQTADPVPIRIYTADFDGLGRLRSETLPRFDDDPGGPRKTVNRTVRYHLSGNIHKVSALDAPWRDTTLTHDYRGRPLRITQPDGRTKSARLYSGVRTTVLVDCVDTGTATTQGFCNHTGFENAETYVRHDWKGRVFQVDAPLHDPQGRGFRTTFHYDPLDKQVAAIRKHDEDGTIVSQTRAWDYDGRGFLTRETIPERGATTFSDFTTRGLPRIVKEGTRQTGRTYDRVGRLRRIAVGDRALKRYVYCDPQSADTHPALCATEGPQNGQLVQAIRNNYRETADSGVDADATWIVDSRFGYDTAGRMASRDTSVYWGYDWSTNPAPQTEITTFDQSWTYDDLGNVVALGYPGCDTQSTACTDPANARTVGYTFRQGAFLTSVNAGTLGATLKYHSSGLVDDVRHQDGHGTDRYGVADGMPRIVSIDLGIGSGRRFDLGTVHYDFAGNITAIGDGGTADTFRYDRNSRLAEATVQGQARTYHYDTFDNLRNFGLGAPSDTGAVDPYTNRLTGGGVVYDTFGNLTEITTQEVQINYDELDKVAGLTDPSGTRTLGFYDHDDLRVLTLQIGGGNPETTWTLRNGLHVIREYVGLGIAIKLRKDYVYAGARRIASKTTNAGPQNGERHYHEDQVGNARLITGIDPKRVHYEPFGEVIGDTSGERAVGFQGHEDDGFTTYMRGRTYLPFSHRFLQVDPARDPAAWSQYAFVANNPIRAVDPTGLSGETTPTRPVWRPTMDQLQDSPRKFTKYTPGKPYNVVNVVRNKPLPKPPGFLARKIGSRAAGTLVRGTGAGAAALLVGEAVLYAVHAHLDHQIENFEAETFENNQRSPVEELQLRRRIDSGELDEFLTPGDKDPTAEEAQETRERFHKEIDRQRDEDGIPDTRKDDS